MQLLGGQMSKDRGCVSGILSERINSKYIGGIPAGGCWVCRCLTEVNGKMPVIVGKY